MEGRVQPARAEVSRAGFPLQQRGRGQVLWPLTEGSASWKGGWPGPLMALGLLPRH